MDYHFKHVILGGTFDHFHAGHKSLITAAFAASTHVTIGLTVDLLSPKVNPDSIESYEVRLTGLCDYLKSVNLYERSTVVPITDFYGTTLVDTTIEAIFVTQSTITNANLINSKRVELGLSKLDIITVPHLISEDGNLISSSRIRSGLIDRDGHSYLKYFSNKPIYLLPDNLRASLQVPLGTVLKDVSYLPKVISTKSLIISVGDIVSIDLQKAGYTPQVIIVDYHTRRHNLDQGDIHKYFPSQHFSLDNLPGNINSKIAGIFLQAISQTIHPQIIGVVGEEDLLAIPVILLSPLGSYLVYGQFQVGMCIVKITEELKNQIKLLLAQFA